MTQQPASGLPRGLRNNNPLNIRLSSQKFVGEIASYDKSFKQFTSLLWGYRAAIRIIHTYMSKYELTTPALIIARWAPERENDVAAYIDTVCKRAQLQPHQNLHFKDKSVICALVSAMSYVENGRPADDKIISMAYDKFNFSGYDY